MFKRKGKICYIEAEVIDVNREIVHRRGPDLEKLSVIFRDINGRDHYFHTRSAMVSDIGTLYTMTTSGAKVRLYEGDKGVLVYKQYDKGHDEYVDFFRGMKQEHVDLLSGKKPNALYTYYFLQPFERANNVIVKKYETTPFIPLF